MEKLRIALVIQNCPFGSIDQNIESTKNFVSRAAEKSADIIVFPEMNLTGYTTGKKSADSCLPTDADEISQFSVLAKKNDITILAGIIEKSMDGKLYAAHLIFSPDGGVDRYRKIHTAPFEKKFFSAGSRLPLFECKGFTFGIQLCYDAHYPELSLAMALKGADIIFIPHASPRGTSREKYESWSRHLTARAFDNGIYIAACNQTGNNNNGLDFPGLCLLIGPDGNIVYHSLGDGMTESMHMVELDKAVLDRVRSHKMRYFLPNRRNDLFRI